MPAGTPTLTIKKCPQCGDDVEIFSSDAKVQCSKCGLTIFNDMNLCIRWCARAKECWGSELYEQFEKADTKEVEKSPNVKSRLMGSAGFGPAISV